MTCFRVFGIAVAAVAITLPVFATRFVGSGSHTLFTKNQDGSGVINLSSGYQPSLNSNGSKIVYVSWFSQQDVRTSNIDGTNVVTLTSTGVEQHPEFSPDGTKIVWMSVRSTYPAIWLMNSDGTNQIQLTAGAEDDYPTFSNDGSTIYFVRNGDVWRMNADGTMRVRLTTLGGCAEPEVSPDGDRIAFARGGVPLGGGAVRGVVWTMNADGSNATPITPNNGFAEPCWSPDGAKLFFAQYASGGGIGYVHADGSNLTIVTDGESPAFPRIGQPVTIAPTNLNVSPGSIVSGSITDVLTSDNSYMRSRPGAVLATTTPPLQVAFTGTSVNAFPSGMQVTMELASTAGTLEQKIQLHNFQTGNWDTYSTVTSSTSDTTITAIVPNPSDYVVPATGAMVARVTWKPTGPVLFYPWICRVDLVRWTIWP